MSIKPIIPVHPRNSARRGGIERAPAHSRIAPLAVFATAQNHAENRGTATRSLASRKPSASMPGQAKRKPRERDRGVRMCDRARDHTSNLILKKIVNERIHMNTHGGTRLRQASAARGNTKIGNQESSLRVLSRSICCITKMF